MYGNKWLYGMVVGGGCTCVKWTKKNLVIVVSPVNLWPRQKNSYFFTTSKHFFKSLKLIFKDGWLSQPPQKIIYSDRGLHKTNHSWKLFLVAVDFRKLTLKIDCSEWLYWEHRSKIRFLGTVLNRPWKSLNNWWHSKGFENCPEDRFWPWAEVIWVVVN